MEQRLANTRFRSIAVDQLPHMPFDTCGSEDGKMRAYLLLVLSDPVYALYG